MKTFASRQSTQTQQALSRRSVLMLFAAMAVALAAGLLAWGPIVLDLHRDADVRKLGAAANVTAALTSAAMVLAGLAGWAALRWSRWALALKRPWACFFVSTSLSGVLGVLHSLPSSNAGLALMHAAAASGFTLLLLGFLAERVDGRFGSMKACIGAIASAAAAAVLWWSGAASHGAGDLRTLMLMEILPLLLIPAGALDLRGRYTSNADWVVLMCLYAIATICDWAHGVILDWTGWVNGHAVSQLGCAAVAAWIAWRCTQAAHHSRQPVGSFGDSSQRKASLNTSC